MKILKGYYEHMRESLSDRELVYVEEITDNSMSSIVSKEEAEFGSCRFDESELLGMRDEMRMYVTYLIYKKGRGIK